MHTHTQTETVRQAYEKAVDINKAYCSGYKWIVKNVQTGNDTDEMPDLDALESVTLIQKLERAQAENNTCRYMCVCVKSCVCVKENTYIYLL